MSKLVVELPDSLRQSIVDAAAAEGISIDQFLALAAEDRVYAQRELNFLQREGARGRREDVERYLSSVPDREPDETDRLPE